MPSLIGSNLSAKVELWANAELKAVLDQLSDSRFVLITSQVTVNAFDAAQLTTDLKVYVLVCSGW